MPTTQPVHEFHLILSDTIRMDEDLADQIYGGPCGDCNISVRLGRVCLVFERRAPTLKDAIFSAIKDYRDAGYPDMVMRVDDCNLVTQAEIGRRSERHKQQVHQWIKGERGDGNFPPPICEIGEGKPLYLWCEVAYWLHENSFVTEEILHNAEILSVINSVLELRHQKQHGEDLVKEVEALIF